MNFRPSFLLLLFFASVLCAGSADDLFENRSARDPDGPMPGTVENLAPDVNPEGQPTYTVNDPAPDGPPPRPVTIHPQLFVWAKGGKTFVLLYTNPPVGTSGHYETSSDLVNWVSTPTVAHESETVGYGETFEVNGPFFARYVQD